MNEKINKKSDVLFHPSSMSWALSIVLRVMKDSWGRRILYVLLDILSVVFSFLLANLVFYYLVNKSNQLLIHAYLVVPTITVIIFAIHMQDGYKYLEERRPENILAMVFKANIVAYIMVIAVAFIVQKRLGYSRYVVLFWFLGTLFLMLSFRLFVRLVMVSLWSKGLLQKRVLLIGDEKKLSPIVSHLRTQRYNRLQFIGSVLVGNERDNKRGKLARLGKLEDLSNIVRNYHVDRIIVDRDSITDELFLNIFNSVSKTGIELNIITNPFMNVRLDFFLDDFTGLFTLRPKAWPLNKLGNRILKRVLDLVIAVLAMPVFLVIMVFVGILIKLEDRGPVFYRRRVLGMELKEFDAFKFRSMCVNADDMLKKDKNLREEFKKNFKIRNDPRVTRVGRILRRTSLDELPQILNVLKGEMSIVGPRMIVREELDRYGDFAKMRFKVKPGITGYWQVMGRQEIDYEERMEMDRFYIEYWSIWMDIVIIIQTFWKVLKREGAY